MATVCPPQPWREIDAHAETPGRYGKERERERERERVKGGEKDKEQNDKC